LLIVVMNHTRIGQNIVIFFISLCTLLYLLLYNIKLFVYIENIAQGFFFHVRFVAIGAELTFSYFYCFFCCLSRISWT